MYDTAAFLQPLAVICVHALPNKLHVFHTILVCLFQFEAVSVQNSSTPRIEDFAEDKFSIYETEKNDVYHFLITSYILDKPDMLANALETISKDGFLFSIENSQTDPNENDIDSINCKLIAKFYTNAGICLLIRKVVFISHSMLFVKKDRNQHSSLLSDSYLENRDDGEREKR